MPNCDRTPYVTTTLAEILTACTLVEKALEEADLANLSDDLLLIYVAADELLELAVPTPSEGELHGLPKMATTTHFSMVEFKHVNNPDWDFQPWFAGKAIALKDIARRAVHEWKEFREAPSATKVREELLRHVANCHTYADLVYQELISGRLMVTERSSE